MKRSHRPAQRLRQTIDGMPLETRGAMLRAIDWNPIIVGAYTDGGRGVCPMLAAHRNGGRTSFAAFASAWDRYTGAGTDPRPATEREVRALRTMLEASIAAEGAGGGGELGEAITAHRASKEASERRVASLRRAARPGRGAGERDTRELARHHGWAWLGSFRRLDEYERAVGQLEATGPSNRESERATSLPGRPAALGRGRVRSRPPASVRAASRPRGPAAAAGQREGR